jgi:putative colanic acid biosynthesis UDP-glucose lipid carrier transferase
MQIIIDNPKIKFVDLTSQDLLGATESFISPVMAALSTLFVIFFQDGKVQLSSTAFFLSIIAFFLFKTNGLKVDQTIWKNLFNCFSRLIFVECIYLVSRWILLNTTQEDLPALLSSTDTLTTKYLLFWCVLTFIMQMSGIEFLKGAALKRYKHKKIIFVGSDLQARSIARSLIDSPYNAGNVEGFFDDRSLDRIDSDINMSFLGKIDSVAEYVNLHKIDSVYISLPMSRQKRMLALINSLKNTTAYVHFIPDMFITELIQAHVVLINGSLAISLCDTPFIGLDGAIKRISDIILATVILVLISPIMLLLSIAIKLESTGPVIFKQIRHGLNGEKIKVYKFRSMHTLDNVAAVKQAEKNDARLTRIGGFLRRKSLDELPQFINVLQGRMSIVGPRPHALAHNEEYRKIISGYMLRHIARPGITGLAQVNGYRGETRDNEMMKRRVEYDIKYLKNWSIWLDFHIIFKTILVLLKKDKNAY